MGKTTGIQWTDVTWNPVRGCSRVSQGCVNCYAERQAARFARPSDGNTIENGPFYGFVHKVNGHPAWTGKVELIPHMLHAPLHWKKPARVFVNSMSDLFHEKLRVDDVAHVFAVMMEADWHTFQILTKRADRLPAAVAAIKGRLELAWNTIQSERNRSAPMPWPLPNVHLGVSVEDFPTWDARVHLLKATPASKRFVSYEPALADLGAVDLEGIDQIIVGGESGPGARPFDIAWARNIIAQCKDASVACFVKQLGAKPEETVTVKRDGHQWQRPVILRDRKGGDMSEWPENLRIRQLIEIDGGLCKSEK